MIQLQRIEAPSYCYRHGLHYAVPLVDILLDDLIIVYLSYRSPSSKDMCSKSCHPDSESSQYKLQGLWGQHEGLFIKSPRTVSAPS